MYASLVLQMMIWGSGKPFKRAFSFYGVESPRQSEATNTEIGKIFFLIYWTLVGEIWYDISRRY